MKKKLFLLILLTTIVYAQVLQGDVNSDHIVNVNDLIIVGSNFGLTNFDVRADVHSDGQVNIYDLILVGSNFGNTYTPPSQTGAIIAGHNSVNDFNNIPSYMHNTIKNNLKIIFGRTSHGSQLMTGINLIKGVGDRDIESCNGYVATGSNFELCDDFYYYEFGEGNDQAPENVLSLFNRFPGANDLGNPNRVQWESATRDFLNRANNDRNVVIWSWCGQVSTASESDINTYLSLMNNLERDYPDVTFIYMTGHLDGSGETGNLRTRNRQIRNYAINNNKILYDFEDIESWDMNGVFHPDESDACNWCSSYCQQNSCLNCANCAHSHCYNCYIKGKAFWWLLARIAGWEG